MDLKNINFTDFVRYVLTGLNFILFVLLLPAIYFNPTLVKDITSDTSVLMILLFSIAIGYLMDIIKVYQFAPYFNKNKAVFRKQIADLLDVPVEDAGSYFSITSKTWDETNAYNLERKRAEWMLILHTAASFFVSSFVWIWLAINEYFINGFTNKTLLAIAIIATSLLLTLRVYRVAIGEIAKHNQEILLIINANKKMIKDTWKLTSKNKSRN